MLRAARFAAKLGFTLHPDTEAPLHQLAYLLDSVPPARLFDETIKLFLAGHGGARLAVLRAARPAGAAACRTVAATLTRHPDGAGRALLVQGLANTDERVRAGQVRHADVPVRRAAVAGRSCRDHRKQPPGAVADDRHAFLDAAATRAVAPAVRRIAIPKRFSLPMRDMFTAAAAASSAARAGARCACSSTRVPRGLRFPAAARRPRARSTQNSPTGGRGCRRCRPTTRSRRSRSQRAGPARSRRRRGRRRRRRGRPRAGRPA